MIENTNPRLSDSSDVSYTDIFKDLFTKDAPYNEQRPNEKGIQGTFTIVFKHVEYTGAICRLIFSILFILRNDGNKLQSEQEIKISIFISI